MFVVWLDASAGEGRPEQIMLHQSIRAAAGRRLQIVG
jgi:hypothetical protein